MSFLDKNVFGSPFFNMKGNLFQLIQKMLWFPICRLQLTKSLQLAADWFGEDDFPIEQKNLFIWFYLDVKNWFSKTTTSFIRTGLKSFKCHYRFKLSKSLDVKVLKSRFTIQRFSIFKRRFIHCGHNINLNIIRVSWFCTVICLNSVPEAKGQLILI